MGWSARGAGCAWRSGGLPQSVMPVAGEVLVRPEQTVTTSENDLPLCQIGFRWYLYQILVFIPSVGIYTSDRV